MYVLLVWGGPVLFLMMVLADWITDRKCTLKWAHLMVAMLMTLVVALTIVFSQILAEPWHIINADPEVLIETLVQSLLIWIIWTSGLWAIKLMLEFIKFIKYTEKEIGS
jgi:hypothetical protein